MVHTWEVRRGGEQVALAVVSAAGHAVSAVALRQRRRGRARSEVGQVEGDRLAYSLQGLLGFSFMRQVIFVNCFSGFGTDKL